MQLTARVSGPIPMVSFAFRRASRDPKIAALYGVIVAQARSPIFYRKFGVPDTVPVRIEMIILHLVLVLRRLRSIPSSRPLAQGVFDIFCRDMDDNFREMGVGDLKVPKEMQAIAGAFYGRAHAYDAALDAADHVALTATVARNVFAAPMPSRGASGLAAYMEGVMKHLGRQEDLAILSADVAFPDPANAAAERPFPEL